MEELETSASTEGAPRGDARVPDLFSSAGDRLAPIERFNIGFVRRTLSSPVLNRLMGWGQRFPGAGWVDLGTRRLRHVAGLERLPGPTELGSFILVSNHRSYFDLFVLSMVLMRSGLRNRMLFPVRSNYFYTNPTGIVVNGLMSFFSMYPPIFRDRKKAALNYTAMNEVVWFLTRRGYAAGMHPEGTRKKDDDPYTFLPAQSGVGRAIYHARVPVVPAFINGLGNNLPRQLLGNFTGKGRKIVAVFGAPVDFEGLLDIPASARTYRLVAERALAAIGALGQEEKRLRAELEARTS